MVKIPIINPVFKSLTHPTTKRIFAIVTSLAAFGFFITTPNSIQTPLIGPYIGQFQQSLGLGPKLLQVTTGCGPQKNSGCYIQYQLNITTNPVNCFGFTILTPTSSTISDFNVPMFQGCGNHVYNSTWRSGVMNFLYKDQGQSSTTLDFYELLNGNWVLIKHLAINSGDAVGTGVNGQVQFYDPQCYPSC